MPARYLAIGGTEQGITAGAVNPLLICLFVSSYCSAVIKNVDGINFINKFY